MPSVAEDADQDGHTTDTDCDDDAVNPTLNNGSYRDNDFGLGSGENSDWVDWDQTTGDGGDAGDTTQVLSYGR